MKLTRFAKIGAIGAIAALSLTACAANEGGGGTPDASGSAGASSAPDLGLEGKVAGAGASSQEVAVKTWTAEFQTANPKVNISYDAAGSGAGRESFQAGAVAFAGSDRAFKDDELTGDFKACKAGTDIIELPTYISPIAVAFNVEGVDKLNLDAATVAKLFSGEITKWNDPAIAALNPDATLPDLAVNPVHRGDDSGTTENFTEYLGAAAPEAWAHEADGVWPLQSGEAATGTSGVVNSVKATNGSIGYMDASRATAEKLPHAAIKVGEKFVEYTPEAAAAVVEASPFAEGRKDGDLAIALDRTSEAEGVYPIVLVSYLITCQEFDEKYADQAAIVKGYLQYIASPEGQEAAAATAGNAPITDELRTKVEAAIDLIVTK